MKYLLIILLIAFIPSIVQTSKGKISLFYNDETFDLPVTQVIIRKENTILISIRAEKNDSSGAQVISLQFSLECLSGKLNYNLNDIRLSISSYNRQDSNGKKFTFNYGSKEVTIEMNSGNERMNWSTSSFQFKIDNAIISYSDSGLKIDSSFSGKYKAAQSGELLKTVAEIKDGKFEIIL